jgi:hypothetical protein
MVEVNVENLQYVLQKPPPKDNCGYQHLRKGDMGYDGVFFMLPARLLKAHFSHTVMATWHNK